MRVAVLAAESEDWDRTSRTLWFVLASCALHLLLMQLLSGHWAQPAPSRSASAETPIDLVLLPKRADPPARKQIVETAPAAKAETAAEDAYLGRQTQVVARQTKASATAPFRQAARGGAAASPAPRTLSLGDLGVKMNLAPMGNQGPGAVASTSDYLPKVQNGAETLLNTREYAYFSFFERVRRQLEQYWQPGLRERLNAMIERGRHLASDQEHSTKLTVIMSSEGEITKILVDGSSGVLDLDQAAIEAFNKAGPFPNPPRGLIGNDGTVRIDWAFILAT